MKRFALAVLALLAVAATIVAVLFVMWRNGGRPVRSGTQTIDGLDGAVEIRFDDFAVPHVRASSLRDLALAVGWLHANDRMTQLELGRRHAAGRLSELVGPRALDADRRMRELRIMRTARSYVAALSSQSRDLLDAYAAGVNAWLARRRGDLPPDLRLLRAKPEPWQPADSMAFALLMSRDLSYPCAAEERNLRWLATLGSQRLLDLLGESATIPDELVATARAAVAPAPEPETHGQSNNWTIGASRTASNAPIVANDPHLDVGLPSIWYQATLRSPDYEAAGMTLPGMPIVVIGQGPELAWSFTNTELDNNDLFLERLDGDGQLARAFGSEPLVRERETIGVRGEPDVEIELLSTSLGPMLANVPVLPADPVAGLPMRTLAWTAYVPFDPVAPFVALARARNVDAVPAAIADFVAPVQNVVAADRSGGLLLTMLGRMPDRGEALAFLPSQASDARALWRGLIPADRNPAVSRPIDDLLATANDDIRPPGYVEPLRANFAGPWRADRIRELLAGRRDWWPNQVAEIQLDVRSRFALEIVAALPRSLVGDARAAADVLAGWDGAMELAGPSALFAFFERELADAIFADEFGLARAPFGVLTRTDCLARAMRGEIDASWFDDARTEHAESRDETIAIALERAWREGKRRFGTLAVTWDYGAINRLELRHPLGDVPVIGRLFKRGPFAVPGSATTVCVFAGGWSDDHIDAHHGASMRWIADTAEPDRSLAVLPGGQSGHPFDDHYDDQIALYLKGVARPVYWSDAAIAQRTRSIVRLAPLAR